MKWGLTSLTTAAAVASGAAVVIMQPWAFAVAAMLGAMVADPDGMAESARKWRTTDQEGVTAELDELNQQLGALKKQLQEKGTWEGGAFSAFDAIHTSYQQSVDQLKSIRNGTGNTLDETAKFWNIASYFCSAIAGVMAGIATAKMLARTNPITIGPAEVASAAAGQGILQSVRSMSTKMLLASGAVTGVLYQAVQGSTMTMPNSLIAASQAPFNSAQYTPGVGLTEKPGNMNLGLGNTGGGLPS